MLRKYFANLSKNVGNWKLVDRPLLLIRKCTTPTTGSYNLTALVRSLERDVQARYGVLTGKIITLLVRASYASQNDISRCIIGSVPKKLPIYQI